MNEYRVRRARHIAAEMNVPGDLAISQRAVLVAALANGPSVLSGFLPAAECLDTVQVCQALGVKFDYLDAGDSDLPWQPDAGPGTAGPSRLRVHGRGGKLHAPSAALDCGSSRTLPVLLSGLLAGQPFPSTLNFSGNDCLDDIELLTEPLRELGATLRIGDSDTTRRISLSSNGPLHGPVPGPSVAVETVRDALLLAGLQAQGKLTLTDASAAPDHLELLLRHWQVKTARDGLRVSIWGGQTPESRDLHIPGDLSYAAPFIAAAAAQPGSTLTIRGVGLNPARSAFLRVLIRMGAQVREEIGDTRAGEASGSLIVRGAPLQATVVKAAETATLLRELPAICMAAALAGGGTVIERTPASSAQLDRMEQNLQLMGVEIGRLRAGIEIRGSAGELLLPGCIPSRGDPHIAMACAAAALFTDGETVIENVDCVESRWRGFGEDLQRCQHREISEGIVTPMLQAVRPPGITKPRPKKQKPAPRPGK
jgi:3-phosphoshikimate 1-carboxyvinyltransferase